MNANTPTQAADCARTRRMLPLLAQNLAPEKDAAAARTHLATCAACQAENAIYERAVSALRRASRTLASTVPPLTTAEILRAVTASRPAARSRTTTAHAGARRGSARRAVALLPAVAAVLAVVALTVALFSSHIIFSHTGGGMTVHALSPDVSLRGVSMDSATDGWAVGDDDPVGSQSALMLHFTGGRWEQVALPAGLDPSVSLNGVSMDSATDGWAVGSTWPESSPGGASAVLLHYKGGDWHIVPTPMAAKGGLTIVSMRTASDGWLVSGGRGSGGSLLRYNGVSWLPVNDPALDGYGFTSVAPVAADDVWVVARRVGTSTNHPASSILHFDGRSWTSAKLPLGNSALAKIVMVTPTQGWAVGGYCGCGSATTPTTPGGASQAGALILRYQDGVWTEVTDPNSALGQYLFDAALSSPTEGWAVGFGGTLLHYHGGAWTPTTSPTTKGLLSVSLASASDGWAVGDQGTMVRLRAGAWSVYTDVSQLASPATTPVPTATSVGG